MWATSSSWLPSRGTRSRTNLLIPRLGASTGIAVHKHALGTAPAGTVRPHLIASPGEASTLATHGEYHVAVNQTAYRVGRSCQRAESPADVGIVPRSETVLQSWNPM